MKNLTTSFARAAMLLLLAVFTTTPAQATDYITDVIVLGHTTSEGIAALCTSYQNQGYTIILSELNSGLNNKPCIYLGYKTTSNPTAGSVITDFYIRGASSNVSSPTLTYNGHTYNIAQFAGDTGFSNKNGDLNYGAGGDYIHLFYTKEQFDDWRLVTGITINNTQSGAVGQNGGTTGYNLNNGCDGGNAIYMHFTTARGPVFLQSVTSDFTAINGDILTGTLDTENHPVKVSIADGATVTLRNATINGVNNSSYDWAGITCEGNATIVLASGTTNIVKGFYYSPGIYIPQDKTLTIKGSGTLNVSSKNVGIGSNSPNNGGNIVIQGGTINATGGSYAPGIGVSGLNQTCGNITISGGTVNATGGSNAPGIGSCDRSTCGNITISGGTVNATGGSNAPGIGSDYTGTCGNISITTGVTSVTAKKGEASNYSIGARNGSSCGTITIGGVVTGNIAQSPVTYKPSVNYKYTVAFNSNGGSGSMANQQLLYGIEQALRANTFTYYEGHNLLGWSTTPDGEVAYTNGQSVSGIVGATANSTVTLYAQWNHNIDLSTLTGDFTAINGDILNSTLNGNHKISIANGATVTLRNVTINGSTTMTYYFAGINCLGDATIILEGTNDVKSFSPYYPCIYVPENKTLTIKGNGTLDANNYSNSQSAGIGGGARYTLNNVGYHQRGGNIVIEGGTINAKGGNYDGAGIGCGSNSSCGYILIKGGTINATGCSSAAGIGSCGNSSCGDISITTGVTSVEATMGIYASNSIGAGHQGTCGTVSIGGVETGNISQSPFVTYPYTVAFNANGGAGTMTNQILMYNVPQNLSNNTFTHTNSIFAEWNTQADGSGTALADGQNVSTLASTSGATVTLYAQWQSNSLTDGTAYRTTQDGSVTTATYRRTIEESRVGKHQSWLVPFDYAITADDLEKFSFYKINMIANSPNPSQDATNQMWLFLTKLETAGTVLHANMPYVIKAKEAVTNYAFTSSNVTLKAKNTGVILKTETAEDVYSFYATYEDTPASGSDQFYYVSSLGNICLGTSVTIGPYRWIIRKTNKFGGTTSYAREMHFFDGEEDDATGLNEELRMKNEESSEDWYTLDGVKLSGKPTQKGIYIHGGRKEAIR